MKLPRRLARFNKKVTNRIQGQWAWLVPPWGVVVHVGRSSGRIYRTPVMAVVRRGEVRIRILYGVESDWVQNLLAAGGGEFVRRGRTFRVEDPRVVSGQLAARIGAIVPGRTRRGFAA